MLQAADLVELVGGRVQLTRRGGRWWGRCPFHDERTASFCLVPPDFRRFHCFGCGRGGDAITWMQEQEGVGSFADAVESLAERYGVPLRYAEETPVEIAARQASERRRDLLDRAADFYASCLWAQDEAAAARDYLLGRGFDETLLRRFRVGYAPMSGNALVGRAIAKGFSRDQLAETGLARRGRDGVSDFFQGRIMFPISDRRGRVLGFGGRVMPGGDGPKYVNSPERDQFRKRELLFGLYEARAGASRQGWVVVVEGYTDVLALAAAGVEASVACMGTSLTSHQIRELARIAKEIRICFDADQAGETAAFRTVEAGRGIPVRFGALRLPPGLDPGDLLAEPDGLPRLRALAEEPEPLIVRLVRSRCGRVGQGSPQRQEAFDAVKALLAGTPESMERDEAVRIAVSLLRLPAGMAAELGSTVQGPPLGRGQERRPQLDQEERLELRLLALALRAGETGAAELNALPSQAFDRSEHRLVAALIVEGVSVDAWPPELSELGGSLLAQEVGPAAVEELREAVLRLQQRALERRVVALRDSGDETALVQAMDLLRRVREALRHAPADGA